MTPTLPIEVGNRLLARRECMATTESCTGGLIAKILTDIPGSSRWFERGLVSYSNLAKTELLGVPQSLLEQHGAVSREVVEAMAQGMLARAPVQWTLAVTGIAGPGGGSTEKPVGTVWISWAREGKTESEKFLFKGDRERVRAQTAKAALEHLLALLNARA